MKNILTLTTVIVGILFAYQHLADQKTEEQKPPNLQSPKHNSNQIPLHEIERLYQQQKSHVQVKGNGIIIKILPDDLIGSRHQRFIIRYSPILTLLVAHNIDIAPKVKNIKPGDKIEFYGEYIWNNQGGIIHWTHKDPHNRHINGYLKLNEKTYQ